MEDIDDYLKAITEHYAIPKCRSCDCLQGFLTQLKINHKAKNLPEIDEMLVPREEQHQCLGCNPCPPAEIFIEYLKNRRE